MRVPHLSPTILTAEEQRLILGVGRDPITERTLRPIVAESSWSREGKMWVDGRERSRCFPTVLVQQQARRTRRRER